jgi:hypothetical protein
MFDSVPIGGIAQKFPQFDAPKRIYSSPVIQAKKVLKELFTIARYSSWSVCVTLPLVSALATASHLEVVPIIPFLFFLRL